MINDQEGSAFVNGLEETQKQLNAARLAENTYRKERDSLRAQLAGARYQCPYCGQCSDAEAAAELYMQHTDRLTTELCEVSMGVAKERQRWVQEMNALADAWERFQWSSRFTNSLRLMVQRMEEE